MLPTSLFTLGDYAFASTSFSNDVLIIPDSVQSIGSFAFLLADIRGALIIGNGVSEISYAAFMRSAFRGSISIGSNVSRIHGYAFAMSDDNWDREFCDSIPGSLKNDFCWGFSGDLIIPENVQIIDAQAFRDCVHLNGSLVISSQVTSIEEGTFYNTGFNGNLTIPGNVV